MAKPMEIEYPFTVTVTPGTPETAPAGNATDRESGLSSRTVRTKSAETPLIALFGVGMLVFFLLLLTSCVTILCTRTDCRAAIGSIPTTRPHSP